MHYQINNINMYKSNMSVVKKLSIKFESIINKKRKINWNVDRKKLYIKQFNDRMTISKRIKQLKNIHVYQIANEIDRDEMKRKVKNEMNNHKIK